MDSVKEEKPRNGLLILISLFLSQFTVSSPRIIIGLFLIEIAASFGSSVGVVASQIPSASSLVAMVVSLSMGAISLRFRHKWLLVLGLAIMTGSVFGCFAAPDYPAMLIFYSLVVLGGAIALPMASTLVASHFTIRQRSHVMGLLVAGGALAVSFGALIIARIGDWRLAFLGYVFPFAILSLFLTVPYIPSARQEQVQGMWSAQYVEGFKAILASRSAMACLAGNVLGFAGWQAIFLYSSTFFRQQFGITTELASLFVFGGALCVTLGGVTSGTIVNRFGRKNLMVIVSGFLGVCVMVYMITPNLWFSTVARFVGSYLAGMMFSASSSLQLEQLPRYRGTVMSVSAAMQSLGSALGGTIGGLVLLTYGYGVVGIVLGTLAIAGALIVLALAVDTTSLRTPRSKPTVATKT